MLRRSTHCATIALALFALSACSHAPEAQGLGTLSLALTTTTESGVTYRLRGAALILNGATDATINLDAAYVDAPVIAVRIAAGDYELGLKEGWYLERNAGQGYHAVAATLVSANPQFLALSDGETTSVALNFQAGADALTLATGALEIDLDVKAECQEGEWVARSCGPGFEGREVATCEQGSWSEFGPCELPDMSSEPICGIDDDGAPPVSDEPARGLVLPEHAIQEDTADKGVTETGTFEETTQEASCETMASITQKATHVTMTPVETQENATDFYGYGGAIAQGPVNAFTAPSRTTLMLHKAAGGAHALVVVHGSNQEGNAPGKIGLSITEHQGIRMSAWDGENSDRLNMSHAEFKWDWGGCCTDGMALELNEATQCLTMHFVAGEGIEGVDIVTNAAGDRVTLETPYDPFTLCLPGVCGPEEATMNARSEEPLPPVSPADGDTLPTHEEREDPSVADSEGTAKEAPFSEHEDATEVASDAVPADAEASREASETPTQQFILPIPAAQDSPRPPTSESTEPEDEGDTRTAQHTQSANEDTRTSQEASDDEDNNAEAQVARASTSQPDGRGDDEDSEERDQEPLTDDDEVVMDEENMHDEHARANEHDGTADEEDATEEAESEVDILTSLDDFEAVSERFTQVVEDFETFADGSEVARAKNGFVPADGFLHSDKVTFDSWAASTLTKHSEPGEPVAEGVHVSGDSGKWQQAFNYYGCPWEGGDASILATSGENQTSGYEGIQATFTNPVRSVIFDLSLNRFGFHLEVFMEGDEDTPSHTFEVEEFETLTIGAYVSDDAGPGIRAIRLTPRAHGLGGYGVWWWSVWSVTFAM